MIIAIDGPAGAGKSSTARMVARRLNFVHLDTGAMYRAVALAFVRRRLEPVESHAGTVLEGLAVDLDVEGGSYRVLLNGEDVSKEIRTQEITGMVSAVSALPAVRTFLVACQRRQAQRLSEDGRGVVLEGRDIGTVVFPDADLKVFLVADAGERARRRRLQMAEAGEEADEESLRRDLLRRDAMDSSRAVSPLRAADDAVTVDTTRLTLDEQVDRIVGLARERTS